MCAVDLSGAGLHSNTTLCSLWDDIMASGYEGSRHKVQLRVRDFRHGNSELQGFQFGFVDGLARAQIMHAFVSFLADEAHGRISNVVC